MRSSVELRPPRDAAERSALEAIVFQSFAGFGLPRERTEIWMELVGDENLRVALRDGALHGGFGVFDFGQWFGGRRLRSAGIGCVGVLPEARGTGFGSGMMQSAIREFHRDGYVLSVLFPSTVPVYRAAGYEPAGVRVHYVLKPHQIQTGERELRVRPLTDADRPVVAELYRNWAATQNGCVDRSPRRWRYLLEIAPNPIYAYVFEPPGGGPIEGHCIFTQKGDGMGPYTIYARDVLFTTPRAGRRLLSLLADHASTAGEVMFEGGCNEPLLTLLRDKGAEIRWYVWWMLRIVNAERALAERGYPRQIDGEFAVEIEDDVIPENCGRFTLSVRRGEARVSRGGSGPAIRTGIRGLAPLLTNSHDARQLQRAGLLDGPDELLAEASAIFAGPPPWMSEKF